MQRVVSRRAEAPDGFVAALRVDVAAEPHYRLVDDEAWNHARISVSREVRAVLAAALPTARTAAAAPMGLAVASATSLRNRAATPGMVRDCNPGRHTIARRDS
ncbi:hypothetical protein FNJ47_07515 [Bradyrhizobium sp. UFLA 03-164]|uniref:Uncharacterized protein n=1 Tax=Bradyrhizobium uaiense TaxID=2594946 RepID=A0A6P1BBH9_9BRAD|nr:hypothetical protein [Bradyrhizobium uaiense]